MGRAGRALRDFIEQWSATGNRFVVTCRVLDYGEELSGLQRVEVKPLALIDLPVDRSSVRFYHQLLQEYFAAWELLKQVDPHPNPSPAGEGDSPPSPLGMLVPK